MKYETKNNREKSMKQCFEKINKINKPGKTDQEKKMN